MREIERQGIIQVLSFRLYDTVNKIWRWLFGRRRGVYYVGGSGVLPAPLTREEEAEIIARLPYDEEARQLLIEHNLRLVVYIAKRFENTGAGIEDLVSIGSIGLIKAINTFRADKNIKLATYASRCIENEILMYLRKHSGTKAEVSIDEPLNTDWDGNELLLSDILGNDEETVASQLEQMEERDRIRRAVSELEEREREIIELRYGMGGKRELTQKEVADRLGISQSYISRLEKKIIAKLKDEIKAEL
ncbi:MAG: RNA polymerase sporulation sigma factor SigE [Clostridia bacterium]|nr:RNA polymerase sporulation sigma factor SigE [Clostridia bacterium]